MPHDHDHNPSDAHHHQNGTSEHEHELVVANELIGYANSKLSEGMNPVTVAAGMRHAAANFTAFASVHAEAEGLNVEGMTAEFRGMLEYYGERHEATVQPKTGLEKLVEAVKNE